MTRELNRGQGDSARLVSPAVGARRIVNYLDGTLIEPGDLVLLDGVDRGRVVASIDTARHLPEHGGWAYLGQGIMVDTEFAGMVHSPCEPSVQFRRCIEPPRRNDRAALSQKHLWTRAARVGDDPGQQM